MQKDAQSNVESTQARSRAAAPNPGPSTDDGHDWETGKSEQGHPADWEGRFRNEAKHLVQNAEQAVRKPAVGAAIAGVAALAAGAVWGITEAAVAAIAGYAVFRALAKRRRREDEPTSETEES